MTYGIPYQGSKSRIAEALIRVLPSGKRFVDLFGGGAAMTHIAALSGKYESVLYNDIQYPLKVFVQRVIDRMYSYNNFIPRFVSRKDFETYKDNDAYIKYMWSFSNNGRDYLYNREIEEEKRVIHNYIVYNERGKIAEIYPKIILKSDGINERRLEWRDKSKKFYGGGEAFWQQPQLIHLNRLQRMNELFGRDIRLTNMDYREYEHKSRDVVYCDIPYEGARGYDGEFDHKAFYDWADSRPYPVYFSSYDKISDDRFSVIWTKEKQNKMNGSKSYDMRTEALYTQKENSHESGIMYMVERQSQVQGDLFGTF